jgi:glutaredoxin-like YruB-family protein
MAKKVRLFTTPTCPWCAVAKKFLQQHGIEFEEIDVSADRRAAKEMIRMSGQTGVPVIQVDDTIIVGFDEERLREVLGLG